MRFSRILILIILPFLAFCIAIAMSFYIKENGDMDSVLLGTIEYSLYALLLIILNYILFTLGVKYLSNKLARIFPVFFTSIIWGFILYLTAGNFTILYWRLTNGEIITANASIIIFNLIEFINGG